MQNKEISRAVAAVVYGSGETVLVVRRRASAADFPLAYALPSLSLRPGEDDQLAITRLGVERLGCKLTPTLQLAEVTFERDYGPITMALWKCDRHGFPCLVDGDTEPVYKAITWLSFEELAKRALPNTCCSVLCKLHGHTVKPESPPPSTRTSSSSRI
jgi:8-oxo-dGTP pyrophosphatase MutT (NUDIX family)